MVILFSIYMFNSLPPFFIEALTFRGVPFGGACLSVAHAFVRASRRLTIVRNRHAPRRKALAFDLYVDLDTYA